MELEKLKNFFPEKVWDYTPVVLLLGGGLWIVIKVAGKIVSKVNQKRMLKRWENTPKDVVIVHRFQSAISAPNASPFVLKLETYLRMAKIPYEVDENDPMSWTGKSPWISLNSEHISDSQLCIEFLAKKFGKKIGNYSDEQRALSTMARIMMDEHFYWGLVLWRYVYTQGKDCHKIFDISGAARIIFPLVFGFFIKYFEKACWYQGSGRNSKEDVFKIMTDDLRALSRFIGNKKFLLGDEATEDDAAVFGELAQVVWCCPDSPYEKLVNEELKNLKEYCLRMKTTFWPDWDDWLSAGRKQAKKNKNA